MGEEADYQLDQMIDGADRWWGHHRRLVRGRDSARAVARADARRVKDIRDSFDNINEEEK